MAKDTPIKPALVQPAPTVFPANIPKIKESNLPQVPSSTPKDEDYTGSYTQLASGEEFALVVVDNDPLGRTHKAKNSLHFWEGTKDEFRAQFDVKDGDKRVPKEDAKK